MGYRYIEDEENEEENFEFNLSNVTTVVSKREIEIIIFKMS